MEEPLYRETQWMHRVWWVILIVVAVALSSWVSWVQQILLGRPFGSKPGPDWMVWLLWLAIGIGFPLFFGFMRLTVEVWPDRVSIRYVPLLRRRVPMAEIERVGARTYRPVLEYGGWGIRGWTRGTRVYSIRGDRCVDLDLEDGTTVVIGTQHADELAEAISGCLAPGGQVGK